MVPTYIFAVLIFVSCVLCENCVIYDFEDDLANNFTSHEVCNQQPWERKLYPSGEVNSPHIKSTAFITPSTVLSCMTSSLFAMHKDGVFEFNVYTSLTLDTDFVKVIVYQKEIDGPDTIVGISETNLVAGSYKNSDWTTLKVKLLGSESFNGYFTIFGRASMDSLIVMDALKYESPFLANEICEIYADDDADPDSGSTENYPGSSDSNESTVGTVSTESYPGSSDSNESTVGTVSTESYPGSSDSNESTVGTVSTESYPGSSDSNESTVGTVSTESYPGSSDSNQSTVGTVSTESYPGSSDSNESTVGTVSTESYPGSSDSNESTVGTVSTESYPGTSDSNESTVGTVSTESYPGTSDSNESTVGTVSTESYPGTSDSNESTVGTVSTESYPGTSDSNESTVGTGSTESYPGTSDSNESTVGTVSTESYPGTSDSNESTVGTVSTESYPGTSDSNESTVGTGSTESYPGTSDSNETDPDSESNENPGAGCVTYQFGQDFNSLFSNDGVCRYSANWLLRNYTSLTIDSPHKNSVSCIIPGNEWSCTSSFTFPMSAGGILEVEVYLEPFSAADRVLVTVYQINSLGTDLVVGSAGSDRQFGWSTLRIQLAGDGDYDGQVTIMGQVAIRSLVIVDSFRYIPPTVDESLCIVYDETPVISPTTEANEASTTPEVEEPDSEEDGCVTYQFGQDYNTLFSSDGVCRYSANWLLRNYSMLAIDSPHEDSFSCIIPGNGWSCTSSFIFPMSAGGILEMKVYLQPFLAADRVLVTVYQINSLGTDLVVGSAGTDRQFGWSTLRIQLAGDGDFDGQITIMGQVAIRSVVLVDSFRYIPPSSNEENCKIYN